MPEHRRVVVAASGLVLAIAIALASPAIAKDPPRKPARSGPVAPCPTASEIVVRRQHDLGVALQVALRRVKGLGPTSNVAFVVDPTEAVRKSRPAIAAALASLSTLENRPQSWQVGGLGGSLCPAVEDPAALGAALDAAMLRKGTPPPLDTLGSLLRAARKAAGSNGAVVYLAHARFEDAVALEPFIAAMAEEKRTLCVVGPEAAFERPWADPVPGLDDRVRGFTGERLPGAGSSPFEADDPAAPWRSGDTAYPMGPYRFAVGTDWDLEFRGPIDLEALLANRKEPERPVVPTPSAFGPYGLMRAAGATGGCYVLFGWTRSEGPPSTYDYVRCNDLAPDLRARAELTDDLPRRPLATALLEAWNTLAEAGVADTTPPWYGTRPSTMRESRGDYWFPSGICEHPADRDDALAAATRQRALFDGVLATLAKALADAGLPKDAPDRRLRADLELLQHALQTIRFHTHEFVLGLGAIPKSAWARKAGRSPHLEYACWIQGSDGASAWSVDPKAPIADPAAADRLLADRRAFIERYKGTPYAAIVERNWVWVFKLDDIDLSTGGSLPHAPRGKGSSRGAPAPPPPPGAGSAGSTGPTTGK